MPRKKGTKMGPTEHRKSRKTDEQVILDFLADVITALRGENVRVKEIERREFADIEDHSFPVTEAYRLSFRGVSVLVNATERQVALDGVNLGEDILGSRVLNAIMDCYTLLRGDCAERAVMQNTEDEHERRARQERERRELRSKSYRRIADKLRARHKKRPKA